MHKSAMLFLSRDPLILLWVISVWTCIQETATADVAPYGQRLKPLKGVVTKLKLEPQLQTVPQCISCHNKSAAISLNNAHGPKIEKRIDFSPYILKVNKDKTLEKTQQTANPIYSGAPNEKINNRGATFFFTQVEPHRYEYRAMFQHQRDDYQHREAFQPFVHKFQPFSRDFPPLPKFPTFPDISQLFNDPKNTFPNFPAHKSPFSNFEDHKAAFPDFREHNKDPFPNFHDSKDAFPNFHDHKDPFPNFPEFTFPTLNPEIKRIWEPDAVIKAEKPGQKNEFDVPLVKDYDVILGHNRYPKIFKFNEERINIEEFDREKKLRLYRQSQGSQNEIEHENVKRDHLLILHGGIFTVQEPPLFKKKARKSRMFGRKVS